MFWILLAVLGALLTKFGALSVLVVIQSAALKVALAVFVVLAVVIIWRRYR